MAVLAVRSSRRGPAAEPARLPFVLAVGPYRLRVLLVEREALATRSERMELDVNTGTLRIDAQARGWARARLFLRATVRLVHYAAGTQDGGPEEAACHALATGLVDVAHRNPDAWVWFNRLLEDCLPAPRGYDRLAREGGAVPAPGTVRVRDWIVPLRALPDAQAARLGVWGDYDYRTHVVRLCAGLRGAHRAVVTVHEITHAVHHRAGLATGASRRRFVTAQVDGWLHLARHDPDTWRWLLALLHASRPPRESSRHGSRAG